MSSVLRPAAGLVCALAASLAACGQEQPRVVDPGAPDRPPADAVILFDGKDLSSWTTGDGRTTPGCTVADGAMTCRTGTGNLFSRQTFHNAQIHLEFSPPYMPDQTGQARGNSGVYLHGRYELQILDSWENPTYPTGACGAIYGQSPPLVNASRPPGEWQSYDIVFHGPKCDPDGTPREMPSVTVLQNGVLIQDHVTILKTGGSCEETGPLMLQDHNYPGAPVTLMRFRNIWLRPLD